MIIKNEYATYIIIVICISVHRVCSYGVMTLNFRMEHCHRFHFIDMAADYELIILVNIKKLLH